MLYWIALWWVVYSYRMWLSAIRLRPYPRDDLQPVALFISATMVLCLILVIGPFVALGAWVYDHWSVRHVA